MKEQIQAPFDTNSSSDKEREEGSAKSLGRPRIAAALQKPKPQTYLMRHCSCGREGCQYPGNNPLDHAYEWVYKDRMTGDLVVDPGLPKRGNGDFQH